MVTNPEGHVASGRAEETILVHEILHYVQNFVNKKKKYHAAAGESSQYRVQMPSLQTYRVTHVN